MRRLAVLACLALAAAPAAAAADVEIEGVSFPDTLSVGGRTLHLIGAGLREVTFLKVDVYAGAAYAERKSCDLRRLATDDQARAFRMDFLRDVPAAKLLKNQKELIAGATPADAPQDLRERLDRFNALFDADAKKGMRAVVSYVPGAGTSVTIDGRPRGETFPGADFAQVVFGVWFGPKTCCPNLIEGIRETCR